jgi:methylamine utilization protein MauE
MRPKAFRFFSYSAGILLSATAMAKLISAAGSAQILEFPDPILAMPFRDVFWIVGFVELVVAFMCFSKQSPALQAGAVAWLATNFVAYRFGLLWLGNHKPCPCLGNLTGALHISTKAADFIMNGILAYLLVGSYTMLLYLWKQRRRAPIGPQPQEIQTVA